MEPPATTSFAEIKRRLDPKLSYLVIENTSSEGAAADFDCVRSALARVAPGILEWRCFRDDTTGRYVGVVSLLPDQGERVKCDVLSCNLPEHMVVYYYGSQTPGAAGP
jgi:hypothetical protein